MSTILSLDLTVQITGVLQQGFLAGPGNPEVRQVAPPLDVTMVYAYLKSNLMAVNRIGEPWVGQRTGEVYKCFKTT